jgi:hypothetical protein
MEWIRDVVCGVRVLCCVVVVSLRLLFFFCAFVCRLERRRLCDSLSVGRRARLGLTRCSVVDVACEVSL